MGFFERFPEHFMVNLKMIIHSNKVELIMNRLIVIVTPVMLLFGVMQVSAADGPPLTLFTCV
jgi:hypothetical protein